MQVAILCGGLGTRLKSVTKNMPKPMVDVLGKPFLYHQLNLLHSQGFNSFLLLAGYGSQYIIDYFEDSSLKVEYSVESSPLGTGGGLLYAKDKLDDRFLLLNGDSYLDIDYRLPIQYFIQHKAFGLLCTYVNNNSNSCCEPNNILVRNDKVTFYQKQSVRHDLTHLNAGASIFSRDIFAEYFSSIRPPFSFENTILPRLISDNELLSYEIDQQPYDIGTPERYNHFIKNKGKDLLQE